MKKQIALIIAIVALAAPGLLAQGRKALRINEVMVENQTSVVDDYGQHSAWIELFNSNFAPVEISSVYLTTDPSNPKMYPVPLGDKKTHVGKRQTVVFWADNEPNKGTFHTSFVLVPGKDNWVGMYDADGKTLIDSVTVPASVLANQSYARTEDGVGTWKVRTGGVADYITPGGNNIIKGKNPKIEEFATRDSSGAIMTVMAMGIVFTALLILCLAFYGIGELNKYFSRKNKAEATGADVKAMSRDDNDSGEVIAAITMALQQHLYAHDDESNMLTIKKMKRAYSPWSSKIYSLRELPRR